MEQITMSTQCQSALVMEPTHVTKEKEQSSEAMSHLHMISELGFSPAEEEMFEEETRQAQNEMRRLRGMESLKKAVDNMLRGETGEPELPVVQRKQQKKMLGGAFDKVIGIPIKAQAPGAPKKPKKSLRWFDDEVNTGMGPVISCRLFLSDEPIAAC